jgi:hypothetical protein
MTKRKQPNPEETLVESQGVNAGPPVDEEVAPATGGDPHEGGSPLPDELPVSEALSGEAVGLPGQKPGYPGQQRSVDTS